MLNYPAVSGISHAMRCKTGGTFKMHKRDTVTKYFQSLFWDLPPTTDMQLLGRLIGELDTTFIDTQEYMLAGNFHSVSMGTYDIIIKSEQVAAKLSPPLRSEGDPSATKI